MKKTLLFLALLVLGFNLSGCRRVSPPQSAFKEIFSIGTIIEDNSQYLIPGSRQLFISEYGESEQPFTQKQEEIAIQINPSELPAFVLAVQSGIEKAVITSGASIVGHGTGGVTGTSFSIQYRDDQTHGVINVWGIRGEGTNFTIIVLITEG